jgi:hypothetical protein
VLNRVASLPLVDKSVHVVPVPGYEFIFEGSKNTTELEGAGGS